MELFYADDGMIVSSDPAWLQSAFAALVAIFDRLGLMKNVGKTVRMVCHPCQAGSGNKTEEAYGRMITGEGRSYTERQREWVACGECGEFLVIGSMLIHMMTRHGKSAGRRRLWTPQMEGGARTYRMSFPTKGGTAAMSRGGVPGGSSNKDDNAGALRAPERPRHRGDAGGGQPPPPTMSPV